VNSFSRFNCNPVNFSSPAYLPPVLFRLDSQFFMGNPCFSGVYSTIWKSPLDHHLAPSKPSPPPMVLRPKARRTTIPPLPPYDPFCLTDLPSFPFKKEEFPWYVAVSLGGVDPPLFRKLPYASRVFSSTQCGLSPCPALPLGFLQLGHSPSSLLTTPPLHYVGGGPLPPPLSPSHNTVETSFLPGILSRAPGTSLFCKMGHLSRPR